MVRRATMSDLYLEASVLGCLLHSGLTPDA